MDDVWYVIGLLKQEVEEHNKTNKKQFSLEQAILSHIPFFCCPNHFLSREYQKDIQRYLYCKKMSVAPYPGSFGDQPKNWISKCNIIENMLNYVEQKQTVNLDE